MASRKKTVRVKPDVGFERLALDFAKVGVSALESFVQAVEPNRTLLDELVSASSNDLTAVVATWVLRFHLGDGVWLDAAQTAELCRRLGRVRDENARLHICQMLGDLAIPKRNAEQVARFLRECCVSDYKFLRAWACDGFFRLGRQHTGYRQESAELVDRAGRDPAASVRARARHLVAESGRLR